MKRFIESAVLTTIFTTISLSAIAQAHPSIAPDTATTVQTFFLTNTSRPEDANEIAVALRNMLLPEDKIYYVASQGAISISGTTEQLALARKLLGELDRPKKLYRLTYTVTETDAGKRIGTQHLAMIVAGGQKTTLKQGSKIPVLTGNFNAGSNSSQTQFTYLDVGLNFDATLDEFANGVRLRTKVEQSSVAEDKSATLPDDPIIRQAVFEGTSFLSVGKPLILGSFDVVGSTRHLDIDVMMQIVPQ
ncbi:MAG: hypothetical protein ACRYFU_25820 [Janthinobacterium lividum]